MAFVKRTHSSKGPGGKSYGGRGEGKEGKREGRPYGPGGGRFFQRKVCRFCSERALEIDYKDGERLKRFLTEKGKVMPRRITGNCAKHQRILSRAIKRSRHSAMIPFQID